MDTGMGVVWVWYLVVSSWKPFGRGIRCCLIGWICFSRANSIEASCFSFENLVPSGYNSSQQGSVYSKVRVWKSLYVSYRMSHSSWLIFNGSPRKCSEARWSVFKSLLAFALVKNPNSLNHIDNPRNGIIRISDLMKALHCPSILLSVFKVNGPKIVQLNRA